MAKENEIIVKRAVPCGHHDYCGARLVTANGSVQDEYTAVCIMPNRKGGRKVAEAAGIGGRSKQSLTPEERALARRIQAERTRTERHKLKAQERELLFQIQNTMMPPHLQSRMVAEFAFFVPKAKSPLARLKERVTFLQTLWKKASQRMDDAFQARQRATRTV